MPEKLHVPAATPVIVPSEPVVAAAGFWILTKASGGGVPSQPSSWKTAVFAWPTKIPKKGGGRGGSGGPAPPASVVFPLILAQTVLEFNASA